MSERLMAEFEPRIMPEELVSNAEFEPTDSSCENKLGFIALCSSCPLIALYGGCPKEIRENFAKASPAENDALNGNTLIDTADLFGFDSNTLEGAGFTSPSNDLRVATVQITEPSVKTPLIEKKISVRSESVAISEQPVEPKPTQAQKIEQKPKRSYLDLLFDDSVEVVLAPQLMPKKKTVINKVAPPSVIAEPETIVVSLKEKAIQPPTPVVEIIKVEEPLPPIATIIAPESAPISVPITEQLELVEDVQPSPPIVVEEIIEEERPFISEVSALIPTPEIKPTDKPNPSPVKESRVIKATASEVLPEEPVILESTPADENVIQETAIPERSDITTQKSEPEQGRLVEEVTPIATTPEALLEPAYPPKSRQLSESNLLLGVIALLKLVFIRIPT